MGRKNKKYSKSLHEQAYDKLQSMLAFGESKRFGKKDGSSSQKIYSRSTYRAYKQHIEYFLAYVQATHPECRSLVKARAYVYEWLQARADQVDADGNHLSAWTLHLEASAVNKLYGIKPEDPDYYHAPTRRREDIKRSRISAVKRDAHFSLSNNDELIRFCRGTGLRRAGLTSITGRDLFSRDEIEIAVKNLKQKQKKSGLSAAEISWLKVLMDTRIFTHPEYKYYVRVTEKGGKTRLAPIVGPDRLQIIERLRQTQKNEKVWKYVHSAADIHGYRADYARRVYNDYARPLDELPYNRSDSLGRRYQGDLYICRRDEAGKQLDRRAMLAASKALGHNRIDIVAINYLHAL